MVQRLLRLIRELGRCHRSRSEALRRLLSLSPDLKPPKGYKKDTDAEADTVASPRN